MEIIARISKGSRMDQVYIPKNRAGLNVGSYVLVKPLDKSDRQKIKGKLYLYNVKEIEPIKLGLAEEIMAIIDEKIENENVIITGSFLDKGFRFNDIDIIVISDKGIDENRIARAVENKIKIKVHLILMDKRALIKGLASDPLYLVMLSKCIAKKRFIYNVKKEINYKLLDLHLLKSKILIDNFDILNGNEKYALVRNMIAISFFLRDDRVSKDRIDNEIKKIFGVSVDKIKEDMFDKKNFLRKYNVFYNSIFHKIMRGMKNAKK